MKRSDGAECTNDPSPEAMVKLVEEIYHSVEKVGYELEFIVEEYANSITKNRVHANKEELDSVRKNRTATAKAKLKIKELIVRSRLAAKPAHDKRIVDNKKPATGF